MAAANRHTEVTKACRSFVKTVKIFEDVGNCSIHRGGKLKSIRLYSEKSSQTSIPDVAHRHYPGKLDKFVLVWTKKYPSLKDVPEYVSRETMDKAKNKGRIYLNIIFIGLTIIGCGAMIRSGKAAAARGESIEKMNLDWHKEMNAKK